MKLCETYARTRYGNPVGLLISRYPRCQGSLQFPSEISSVKMCGGPKNARISNGSEQEQQIANEF